MGGITDEGDTPGSEKRKGWGGVDCPARGEVAIIVRERRACYERDKIKIPALGEGDDFSGDGAMDVIAKGRGEAGADILVGC